MALTLADADALIATCRAAGVVLGVVLQRRTDPVLQSVRQAIAAGELGRLTLGAASVPYWRPQSYYDSAAWRGTWGLDGGGALMNQGIHTVDLLLWLVGDVRRVSAATRTALHLIEVEDTAVASFELAKGGVGTLEAATSVYPGYARRLELTGTHGTVIVEHDRVTSVDLRAPPAEAPPHDEGSANASATSPVVADTRGHRRVLEDFISAVRSGGRPLCDGADGRRSVELVKAIYQAARTGTAVTLRESMEASRR
jgi:predicted dehydrogenase